MELPEILRNVFLRLENEDLISCAQVSKKWNEAAVPVLRKKVHIRLQHKDLQRYSRMLQNRGTIHSSLTICVENDCPEGINVKNTLEQIKMIASRAKVIHLNFYFNDKPNGIYDIEKKVINYNFDDQILTKDDIVSVIASVRESLITLRFVHLKWGAYTESRAPFLPPMDLIRLEKIEFWHPNPYALSRNFQFPSNSQYPNLKGINLKRTIRDYGWCGTTAFREKEELKKIQKNFQEQIPMALYQLEWIPILAEP